MIGVVKRILQSLVEKAVPASAVILLFLRFVLV